MNLNILKLIYILVLILGTIAAGLCPLKVLRALRHQAATAPNSRKHKNVSLILCLLTCFSGGVFLATCFLHLFPELVENVQSLDEDYGIHIDYPIAELLSCLGFFLLFFLEEVVILAVPAMAHGHSHGHDEDEHHHFPQKEPVNGECCMITGFIKPDEEKVEKVASEQTPLNDTMSDSEVAAGHCQTHCPLTVHARRQTPDECTAPAPAYTALAFAEPERCETNCDNVDEDPPILMKSRPHAHSHGVRSITFVLALGIHSVIEGLAFGVMNNSTEVTALFVSLLVHKLIVAFSVGLQLARTHAHQLKWVVLSILILALMTPLGALVGMLLTSTSSEALWKEVTVTILQGLAVGTFLYVTFFEVLLHERDNEHPNLLKLLVMLIGFSLIGALRLIDNHDHSAHHHNKSSNESLHAGH